MQNFIKHLGLGFLTLALTACGSGFQGTDGVTSSGSNNQAGSTPTNPGDGNNNNGSNGGTTAPTWDSVSTGVDAKTSSATTTTGMFVPSGIFVVRVDKTRQALEFIVPLPANFTFPIVSMPIPNLDGAVVEQITQPNGALAMGVVVPLKYLMQNTTFGDYGTLPNGTPVPFLPFGKVHGFEVDFPQNAHYRLHLYMAVNGAAVFIETPDWNLPSSINGIPVPTIGFPIYNQGKTQQVAYMSLVPTQVVGATTYSSGVYIASRIPDQVAVLIDDMLQY